MTSFSAKSNSLWNQNFVLACIASFLYFFVLHSFSLFPIFIKADGGSDFQVGIIMGVFCLAALIIRPISGFAIDRIGYKSSALFSSCGLISTLISLQFFGPANYLLLPIRFFMGMSWVCLIVSVLALGLQQTPRENQTQAVAYLGLAGLLAQGVAPLLCEKLLPSVGYALFFRIDVIIAILATLVVSRIREIPQTPLCSVPFSFHLKRTLLLPLLMVTVYAATRLTTFHFMAPFSSEEKLNIFGLYFLTFTTFAFFSQWKFSQKIDGIGIRSIVPIGLSLLTLQFVILFLGTSSSVLLLGAALGGVSQGLLYPSLCSQILSSFDHNRKALALSFYGFAFDLGGGLGLPFFGLISDFAGYRAMFGSCALLLVAANVTYLMARSTPVGRRSELLEGV